VQLRCFTGPKRLAASKYSYLPIDFDAFTRERKKRMVNEAVDENPSKFPGDADC
jgi:hypothetical protein